jgi:type IV pilus assembly protein PilA
MNRRAAAHSQDGFSLVELLVVLLTIGILSAIALPAFIAQQAKARDAAAQSDARTVVSAMEACYSELDRYDPCPGDDPGVRIGSGPGEVEISPSSDTYVIVAHSRTGNTFTVTKNADHSITRTCSAAGNPRGGCVGSSW